MRLGGISGVAYQAENVAALYFVSYFYAQRAGLHVGVEREAVFSDIDDDVVAADGFHGDGHGAGSCSWGILRDAVFGFCDDAVGDRANLSAVRAVIFIVGGVAGVRGSVRVELDPIDGETLRNV